jgi:putative ABC transport system permease protein
MNTLAQFSPSRVWLTAGIAFRALGRNTLRSFLTALGIIIGVSSVVAMAAIGDGAQASITSKVAALGQNLLTVFSGPRRTGGVNSGLGSSSTLTIADADALVREIPGIVAISPEVTTPAQLVANGRNWSSTVAGESPGYLAIRNWRLAAGTMFTEREVRSASRVAVIGSKASHELFGPVNPVGQTVRIRNIPFSVIGLLESKGAGIGGQNQDDRILVPYTTVMRRITGDRYLRSINIQVRDAADMETVQEQSGLLLRQRHRLAAGEEDDFNIFNQKEVAETVDSVTSSIKLLLGAVSGISLLVGGIGIMNIMLVSVTERTREIGLRIAVGAQPAAIRLQFLLEAVGLSLSGGVVGVVLGVVASHLIGRVAGFDISISRGSVALAFWVSFATGAFFGFYPARRAAALDPIEALRHE